jgi:hypothetical protein
MGWCGYGGGGDLRLHAEGLHRDVEGGFDVASNS